MDIKGSGVHTEAELTNWRGLIQAVQTHAPWQISPHEDDTTTQWTDGWLVLAPEQKKRTVPRQGCPRFINSLCVWYVLFLSLQLLTQRAHPASPSTDQQANPIRHKGLQQQASTNHLDIWDIMSISQLARGGGINQRRVRSGICMSCNGAKTGFGEWKHTRKDQACAYNASVSNVCFPFVCALRTSLATLGQWNKLQTQHWYIITT